MWVREPDTSVYRLDIFRESYDDDTRICRRDERIRLPHEQIIETSPTASRTWAEIVLLFKAKHDGRRTTVTSG